MAEAPSAWSFRAARRKDVPAVVRLLADDPLGRERETSAAEVPAAYRNRGLGRVLLGWAVDHAQARGCRIVQLTTDQRRPDALRFYQSLGFRPTHQGLKLFLE